jgi:PAS domain S-box-containing protein
MASAQTPPGLLATQPWMFLKGVIVTRRTAPRVAGIEDFAHQVVAAQRISPGEMEIRQRFPKQSLLVTESVPEMLDAVVDGRADAGVGMLAIVDYALRNRGYGNSLKLAAPFGERDVPVRMLVRKDARVLRDILDKALGTATDEERQRILEHWFLPSIERGLDSARVWRLALTVALPTILLAAFMLYWALRLRREVRWRKEAQSRIADITDSVPGVVFEFIRAPDGSYSAPFVSGAIEELIGLTREAVVEDVGRYFARVLREDIGDYLAAIERSATMGGEVRHAFRITHAGSGEVRWLAVHAIAPRRQGGYATWRGYVVDITEQKRLENDLERALERAESAQRAKSEFLANMSHEIRTPMNAVIGMSHLLMQAGLSARQLNYVAKIDAAAKSLLGIINDALDFSKIEAGKLALEKAPFSLQAVLDNLTTMIGQRAQEKGLELLFDIDPDIPDTLIGDATRLGQILINLCSNAVKFTSVGEIVVSARMLGTSAADRLIRFAVKDTGIGVATELMSRLFQPFEQADASTTRKYGGTGLGLTIAKRLSEMMGGSIGVESEPGRGSTFWFTARLPAGRRSEALSTATVGGMRILIVDDNAAARVVLLSIATSLKLHAASAASGEEAVVMLQEAGPPYDIILVDWNMSGLSGEQLIRAITSKANAPRVILATAYDNEEAFRALELTNGLLTKPVNASALLDAIQRALGHGEAMPSRLARRLAANTAPNLKGRRILLVEDNDVNREVARELLAQTGASIALAANGEEAVAMVKRERFDCVLMDIQMPVMDGETATRLLRSNPALRDLPIIAITASALVGDRDRCIAAGMNDHIVKPIQVPELFAALSRWVKAGEATLRVETGTASASEPAIPPIEGMDTVQGLARANGNVVLYLRLLRKFRENHADVIHRIRVALERGDRQTAAREAHTIVGASANLGAADLADAARGVEAACRSDAPVGAIDLEPMKTVLERLLTSLDHALVSDAPVTIVAVPDRSKVASLLGELRQAIEDHDGTAAEALERLRLALGDDSRIKDLEKHIGRYDFPAAGTALDMLTRELATLRNDKLSGAT